MSATWFVVKHVPDLMRQEPRNVGVLLEVDGQVLTRFLGEDANGGIDGRSVPQFGSHHVYKAWVRHWRSLAARGVPALFGEAEAGRRPGDSFYIAVGGDVVLGSPCADVEDMIGDLYATLVRPDAAPPVADTVRTLTDRVLRKIGLGNVVQRRVSLAIDVDGVPDDLWFDYRYDNGEPHLMQRVGLAEGDKQTWDRLHLVETNFQRVEKSGTEFNRVAFVRQQGADARLLQAANARLGRLATVVDVSQTEDAALQLRELLHVKT